MLASTQPAYTTNSEIVKLYKFQSIMGFKFFIAIRFGIESPKEELSKIEWIFKYY